MSTGTAETDHHSLPDEEPDVRLRQPKQSRERSGEAGNKSLSRGPRL